MERIVVGVSGASGVILAYRAILALVKQGYQVDLIVTPDAIVAARYEVEPPWDTLAGFLSTLPENLRDRVVLHRIGDLASAVSSGSYVTRGMMIIPCSMATVAAIAAGLGDNLLRRAADVTLKERRPLVLVARETPLSEIHLENMLKLSRVGATIVPPMPGWYSGHKTLEEMELFIVGRCLDALHIENDLYPRWPTDSGGSKRASVSAV